MGDPPFAWVRSNYMTPRSRMWVILGRLRCRCTLVFAIFASRRKRQVAQSQSVKFHQMVGREASLVT